MLLLDCLFVLVLKLMNSLVDWENIDLPKYKLNFWKNMKVHIVLATNELLQAVNIL